jgi:hypothetical protein
MEVDNARQERTSGTPQEAVLVRSAEDRPFLPPYKLQWTPTTSNCLLGFYSSLQASPCSLGAAL